MVQNYILYSEFQTWIVQGVPRNSKPAYYLETNNFCVGTDLFLGSSLAAVMCSHYGFNVKMDNLYINKLIVNNR